MSITPSYFEYWWHEESLMNYSIILFLSLYSQEVLLNLQNNSNLSISLCFLSPLSQSRHLHLFWDHHNSHQPGPPSFILLSLKFILHTEFGILFIVSIRSCCPPTSGYSVIFCCCIPNKTQTPFYNLQDVILVMIWLIPSLPISLYNHSFPSHTFLARAVTSVRIPFSQIVPWLDPSYHSDLTSNGTYS